MNPLVLGGAALAALLLLGGGKKAKAKAPVSADAEPEPVRVDVPESPLDKPVVRKQAEQEVYVVEEDGKEVGPEPNAAKELAPAIASHLRARGYSYDREKLAAWQALAGLVADGLYGPATYGALKKYVSNAPKALFKGASR